MDKILLSAVIFIGLLALISGALFSSSFTIVTVNNQTQFTNATNINVSIISGVSGGGFQPLPVCQFSGNLLFALPEVGVCMAAMINWLIGFMFTTSDVPYIAIIFVAVGAVILYRIIRIVKPTGGS